MSSSHRVNFVGGLSTENKTHGLKQLRKLLMEIVKKWPDAEFMTFEELAIQIKGKA